MNSSFLEKYAELVVKIGINIQKDQILVISSPIECADFTRKIAEIAYKEGAGDVFIKWSDELFSKIRFLNAPEKVFEEFPSWEKEFYLSNSRKGAAFLSIHASDPELMRDVDPNRILKSTRTSNIAVAEYRERLMSNKNVWSVISVPTKAWAKKIFKDLSYDEAVDKLWEYIFKAVRADKDDPIAAWEEHKNNLQRRMSYLNNKNFKYLKYKNSLGTDLKVELPEGHIWLGGSDFTPENHEFIANIPTEEVFTLPKKDGVNGTVVSSMPLNNNGNLVENFSLTFKDGKIVDFKAEKGYDTLKNIIETDDGSHYLGEVALVPYDSPISNLKTIFYNTLFDENASCHLAIGNAYPVCLKGGENMTKEELEKNGVNSSLAHVDFMVGTKDLDIVGVTHDGEEVQIFKEGNFVF